MREKKRKNFSGEFKAQVALEAIRGVQTVNEIVQEFGVHPTQSVGGSGMSRRRADSMPRDPKAGDHNWPVRSGATPKIGRLKMERAGLKKFRDQPVGDPIHRLRAASVQRTGRTGIDAAGGD